MPQVEKKVLVCVLVETALVEGKPVVGREPDREGERESESRGRARQERQRTLRTTCSFPFTHSESQQ